MDLQSLPEYTCHKKVRALQIKELQPVDGNDGNVMLHPVDENFTPLMLEADWVQKHKPMAGGYFVVYKDGYKSYSPQQAFEEGYSKDN